jgi:hypothetical protein
MFSTRSEVFFQRIIYISNRCACHGDFASLSVQIAVIVINAIGKWEGGAGLEDAVGAGGVFGDDGLEAGADSTAVQKFGKVVAVGKVGYEPGHEVFLHTLQFSGRGR